MIRRTLNATILLLVILLIFPYLDSGKEVKAGEKNHNGETSAASTSTSEDFFSYTTYECASDLLAAINIENKTGSYGLLIRMSSFILNFFWASIGASFLKIFSLKKNTHDTMSFIKPLFPDRSDRFYIMMDLNVTIVFGSLIGVIFFGPATFRQALVAGFGWASAVSTMLK